MRSSFLKWALVGLCCASFAEAQQKGPLALVGGMLLDGYEAPPIHHAAIIIEGNRIVRVGPASEVAVPPNATVIDTKGRVMLPGLIELHAHLMILGHANYDRWWPWMAKNGVERVMEVSARQLLMSGVTSAADLGAPLKEILRTRDRINRGELPGPRMFVSGPWLTRRPSRSEIVYGITIGSPQEAATATEGLIKAGVDLIKAWGGLTVDDRKAIVEVAHRHNLKVHAHTYTLDEMRDSIASGIDVLSHGGLGAGQPPPPPELVRQVVERGIPVVMSAVHRVGIYPLTAGFPERLEDPQLKEDFPPDIHAEVQASLKDWRHAPYFVTTDRGLLFWEQAMRQWIDGGAVIGMGTDSGTPMNFHTEALWREIKAHVDFGMSPLRAISAATRVGAKILGKESQLGTIEVGKLADIIVVRGNPLTDINSLGNVEVVVKDGVVHKGPSAARAAQTPSARQD